MTTDFKQITIFDLLAEQSTRKELTPKVKVGDTIYTVVLDEVYEWLVSSIFNLSTKFGYSLKRIGYNRHSVVWCHSFGENAFRSKLDALEKAKECDIEKRLVIEYTEGKSFSYIRKLDDYELKSSIAKIGDKELYFKGYSLHSFIYKYKSTIERDKAYKDNLNKMEKETKNNKGIEIPIEFETLYKCNVGYASRDYVYRNG